MLKRLIENEKIRIDAHKSGNREDNNWDDRKSDIHIHKTTYAKINGKATNIEIRIPINSDRDVSYEIKGKESLQARQKLEKEIQEAFANKNKREQFVADLLKVLDNYSSSLSSEDRANAVVKRIAKHFNLKREIEEDIKSYAGKTLLSYTKIYTDNSQRQYFVTVNDKGINLGEITPFSHTDIRLNRSKS